MKFYALALVLGIFQAGCSSEKSQSAAAAGSTVSAAYSLSGGVCTHVKFVVAVPASNLDEGLVQGNCPTSVKVEGSTAALLKKCPSFEKDGSTYTITLYNKNVDDEGEVFEVEEENAEATCEAFETAIQDS